MAEHSWNGRRQSAAQQYRLVSVTNHEGQSAQAPPPGRTGNQVLVRGGFKLAPALAITSGSNINLSKGVYGMGQD